MNWVYSNGPRGDYVVNPFNRCLRAAGVSFEDRQDLLGHRAGRITTHYSAAELFKLIEAANSGCARGEAKKPELVVLRRLAVS